METYEISVDELFEKRHDRIPVITLEKATCRVLGLNITNREAFEKTITSGKCHYFDEINKTVYLKGEHSGEIENVRDINLDCCHARRHELHLLYEVEMPEGSCKFGMADCHFYKFENGQFILNRDIISDHGCARSYWERITTLLDIEDDRIHQQRFRDLQK